MTKAAQPPGVASLTLGWDVLALCWAPPAEGEPATQLAVSSLLRTGNAVQLLRYDASTLTKQSGLLLPLPAPAVCLAFSPSAELLATAGDALRLWRPDSDAAAHPELPVRATVVELAAAEDTFLALPQASLAWRPGGQALAVGNVDGTVALWALAGKPCRAERLSAHSGPCSTVHRVGWRDESTLLSAGGDGWARLWDLRGTSSPVLELQLPGAEVRQLRHVSWAPNGALLAAASQDASAVHLLDIRGGTWEASHVAELTLEAGHVSGLAWAPGSDALAAAGTDGLLRVWPVAEPTLRAGRPLLPALGFDAGGELGSCDWAGAGAGSIVIARRNGITVLPA